MRLREWGKESGQDCNSSKRVDVDGKFRGFLRPSLDSDSELVNLLIIGHLGDTEITPGRPPLRPRSRASRHAMRRLVVADVVEDV